MTPFNRHRVVIAALGSMTLAAAISAQDIEVIYTKIPTSPTSIVPGALDLAGKPVETRFRAFENLIPSPDGSSWMLKGRTQLGTDLENIMLLGSGAAGTMFAQEGQPIPGGAPGELYDFFGSAIGTFNQLGEFAYSARARGGDNAVFQKVIHWNGADFAIVRQMGDDWLGLQDLPPNPSGDELVGNSVGSIHLLNDGTIGSHDDTIQNIHSSRRPAIFYDAQMFHQENVTTVLDFDGRTELPWTSIGAAIDANTFYTTPDGAHWVARGDVSSDSANDQVLVHDGQIQLRKSFEIGDTGVIVDSIFTTSLLANGDWLTRGDQADDSDWAVRNGELLAKSGDPISASENLGLVFSALHGNALGDWVLAATTSSSDPAADEVIVLNGSEVLVREGDSVDLDGDGQFDDDAFIGRGNNALTAFSADNLFIGDDGVVYFFASLRSAAGMDLNSDPAFGAPLAFLRLVVPKSPACPADLNDDGSVGPADLGGLLAAWGTDPNGPPDFNDDNTVAAADLGELLANWGPCR